MVSGYAMSATETPRVELLVPMLLFSDVKISPAKAAELRDKLEEVMNDLSDKKTEDPNGIPVNLLIGCFVPGESDRGTQ